MVTVFGHQDGAEIGYNPRYRGKRSYNPLLCREANPTYLWDAELRAGNAGTGTAAPNCWTLALLMFLPMSANCGCGPMPVSA